MADIHVHQFRKRTGFPCLVCVDHLVCRFGVSGTAALRTGDIDVRKELHVQADTACAVAYRTAQISRVVGEITGLVSLFLRLRCSCVNYKRLKSLASCFTDEFLQSIPFGMNAEESASTGL